MPYASNDRERERYRARIAELEAFAKWVRDVALSVEPDAGLVRRRIAEEAGAVLRKSIT